MNTQNDLEIFPNSQFQSEQIATYTALFKALGDERRLAILNTISSNPDICACGLLDRFQISQSTLSHHMKLLCDAHLVTCRKEGKWAHYQISSFAKHQIESFIDSLWICHKESSDI